jgi:hypothetical protein
MHRCFDFARQNRARFAQHDSRFDVPKLKDFVFPTFGTSDNA